MCRSQCGRLSVRLNSSFEYWQVCEKYLTLVKDVYWAFMDFKKAHDTIDRHGMWQMSRVHEVKRKLLKAVQKVYVDSRACVRFGMNQSEWFPTNVGKRKGCVMSLCLFHVCKDGVVQKENAGVLGKGWNRCVRIEPGFR